MKLVYARNHSNRRDWIVFLCTNLELSEEEVLRRYTNRWAIERYFKIAKGFLQLRGCHSTSYDALTANVTIVGLRYMMLSVERFDGRLNRAIEKLFTAYQRRAKDQVVKEACILFGDTLVDSFTKVLHPTDEQLKEIVLDFISQLPEEMKSYFSQDKIDNWE